MLRNFRLVAAQSSPVSPLGQLDYREGWFAIWPMPVGQIGNSAPMSRRLNRESPCEARGLLTPGPTSSFLGKFANAYRFGAGHGPK